MPLVPEFDLWGDTNRRPIAADNPLAVTILYRAGSQISDEDAARLGLTEESLKMLCGPPEHRARMFPPANKRRSLRSSRVIG